MTRRPPTTELERLFPGDGEMAHRMRAFDWAMTSAGPVDAWPQSLRMAVRLVLNSRYPMYVWWGREGLTYLYNDAYIPLLGAKHPGALGRRGADVWPEIWDTVGPFTEAVFTEGRANWSEALGLIMERHGYREEAYFTFSFSPIVEDDGRVGGLFCACTEDTRRVLAERRLKTQRELAGVGGARSIEEACAKAADSLGGNPHDFPFAHIYLLDDAGRTARLASAGATPASQVALAQVVLDGPDDVWQLGAVSATGRSRIVESFERAFLGSVPLSPWGEPPSKAIVAPLLRPGYGSLAGFAVLGVSPRRELDDDYLGTCELVARHIATGIMSARAYAEERHRAEALAEIDRAKTAFFSNVSHEFRTPLALLLGPLEDTLASTSLPAAERRALDLAHRNSLRLLKLVNTLLDFSRIEAGRVEAAFEQTDVAAYTAELASVFRSAIERAGLALAVECAPVEAPVFLDREMWEKIVLNLLSNAFKFTLQGGITVSTTERAGFVDVTVQDTGMGIPAEELSRIFERFHRVHGSQGRTDEGTGIGLALVSELVKLHGGTVTVRSTVGRGSAFTVTIPTGAAHIAPERIGAKRKLASTALGAGPYVEEALRWLPDAPEVGVSVPLESLTAVSTAGARVLVADDNVDMRDYVARLLRRYWDVEAVADGVEALEAIGRSRPDLVLADVMMPRLDGMALLRAIREDVDLRSLPVILLSARAGEESRVEGLELGADDYLVKPFSARELLARVNAHLEVARVRREALAERERASESLRREEARFRTLVEATTSIVWRADASGMLTDAPRWSQFTGQIRKEYAGAGWLEAIHPDDREATLRTLERSVREKVPSEAEYRLRRRDGVYRFVVVHAVPMLSATGDVEEWVGTVTDITERKQTEEALQVSQARLQQTTEAAQVGTWEWDLRANRLYWSPIHKQLWGFDADREPITFEDFVRQVVASDRKANEKMVDRCLRTGEVANSEYRIMPLGGAEPRWIRSIGRVECDEAGKPLWMRGVSLDVTERRRAVDALQEANERKDEFLAMLAHELRNPLAPIQNATRLLALLGVSEPRLVQARDIIDRQTGHLVRLVDDLLDVSRITRGKISLQREPLTLQAVVSAAVELARPAVDRLAHALTVSHAQDSVRLEGDFARLVQVVSNLLTNAAKFTPAGGRITVTTQQTGDRACIRVRDSGVGIARELQSKVFDLFVQGDGGLARTQGGLGIGLTLAKRIIELHDGSIEVRSEGPGRGSEFIVTLPSLPASVALPKLHSEARLAGGSKPLRILIVEDNPDAADSFTLLLELGGHNVRVAHEGLQALQLVEDFVPDIAFVDVGLPGIDGYELATRLRAHPGCHDCVLAALTGYAREDDKRRAFEAGFDHHLTKPVDFDAVDRLLANVSSQAGSVQVERGRVQ